MSHTKGGITHDSSLENSAGLEMGLTFALDKNSQPIYEESGDPALTNQMFIGLADYAHLPAEKEFQIGQKDFRMGFGLEYDSGMPDEVGRYYKSFGVDARFRGTLMPGPLPTAIAPPSAPSFPQPVVQNAGFEGNWGWTNDGADTSERSTEQVQAGTYAWKLSEGIGTIGRTYQEVTPFLPGGTYTLTAQVYGEAATNAEVKIGLDDGISETLSADRSTESFAEVSVEKTLSTDATRLRIVLYVKGGSSGTCTAYFDTVACTGTGITPVIGPGYIQCDFNDDHFIAFGKELVKLNSTGNGWKHVYYFPYTITSLESFSYSGTDCLFVGQGVGQKPYYLGKMIRNPDMEVIDSWLGDIEFSLSTTQVHAGTYSIPVDDGHYAYQDIPWNSAYQGASVTFTCYVWAGNADKAYIQINDGVGTTNSSYHTGTSAWQQLTVTRTLNAAATQLRIMLYYAASSGTAYFDDAALTGVNGIVYQSSLSDNDAVYFRACTPAGSAPRLYKAVLPNQIRYTANPLNGGTAWSGITYIGAADTNITCLKELGGTIFIGKEDGYYYLDSSGIPHGIGSNMKAEQNTYNGWGSKTWDGKIYWLTGTANLWEYDDGDMLNLSPSLFTTNDTDFDGIVQAAVGDSTYFHIAVDNGTKTEILAGRWEIVNGYTDWRWHPIAEITLTGVQSMAITSVFKKRLYITSTDATENIYYLNLPTSYGNVAGDTNLTFQTGGYLETYWYAANLIDDVKAFVKTTLALLNCDGTNYWTVAYKKYGDSSWTDIDNFGDGSETDQTAYIPDDSGGNDPKTKWIKFKYTCTSDGAAPVPQMLGMDCRGIWYPTKRKIITAQIKCEDNITVKSGAKDTQTEKDIRDFLNTAYDTQWPLAFYPPYWKASSDTKYVKIIDPFRHKPTEIARGGIYKGIFYLTMMIVPLS